MKLQERQQKLLITISLIFISFLIFWIFIYSPANKKMRLMKKELSEIKDGIRNVQRIAGNEESLDVTIQKYNKKLNELKSKLPYEEESTIRGLAEEADKLGIEVISINPDKEIESRAPIYIKRCKCREMIISMELVTSYIKFGNYIKTIREKLPAYIKFNKIHMQKKDTEQKNDRLLISMDITLYLLSESL